MMHRHMRAWLAATALAALCAAPVQAGVILYGDMDVLGTSWSYAGNDGTTGATLEGLAPDQVTFASQTIRTHAWPFAPEADDHPGTDTIYVGSAQTAYGDGYSACGGRVRGPQVVTLDYAALVPAGQTVETFTLGIAADDFQYPAFGRAYTAWINGQVHPALTATLNALNQTGPDVQFFSIGLDTALLTPDHTLTLTIDQAGDGRDGWAIDYLTVGATTVPEPATIALFALAALAPLGRRRQ